MISTVKKHSEVKLAVAIIGGISTICVFAAIFVASKPSGPSTQTANKYAAIGRLAKNLRPSTRNNISHNNGMSAAAGFNRRSQKFKITIKDRDNQPVSKLKVVGKVVATGHNHNSHFRPNFSMTEKIRGEYSSQPLKLSNGNWILLATAYDLYGRSDNKLLFHIEKPIYVRDAFRKN